MHLARCERHTEISDDGLCIEKIVAAGLKATAFSMLRITRLNTGETLPLTFVPLCVITVKYHF